MASLFDTPDDIYAQQKVEANQGALLDNPRMQYDPINDIRSQVRANASAGRRRLGNAALNVGQRLLPNSSIQPKLKKAFDIKNIREKVSKEYKFGTDEYFSAVTDELAKQGYNDEALRVQELSMNFKKKAAETDKVVSESGLIGAQQEKTETETSTLVGLSEAQVKSLDANTKSTLEGIERDWREFGVTEDMAEAQITQMGYQNNLTKEQTEAIPARIKIENAQLMLDKGKLRLMEKTESNSQAYRLKTIDVQQQELGIQQQLADFGEEAKTRELDLREDQMGIDKGLIEAQTTATLATANMTEAEMNQLPQKLVNENRRVAIEWARLRNESQSVKNTKAYQDAVAKNEADRVAIAQDAQAWNKEYQGKQLEFEDARTQATLGLTDAQIQQMKDRTSIDIRRNQIDSITAVSQSKQVNANIKLMQSKMNINDQMLAQMPDEFRMKLGTYAINRENIISMIGSRRSADDLAKLNGQILKDDLKLRQDTYAFKTKQYKDSGNARKLEDERLKSSIAALDAETAYKTKVTEGLGAVERDEPTETEVKVFKTLFAGEMSGEIEEEGLGAVAARAAYLYNDLRYVNPNASREEMLTQAYNIARDEHIKKDPAKFSKDYTYSSDKVSGGSIISQADSITAGMGIE